MYSYPIHFVWIVWMFLSSATRAGRYITIKSFISFDIDDYHDKCHIFISFKFKSIFLLLSEICRNQTVNRGFKPLFIVRTWHKLKVFKLFQPFFHNGIYLILNNIYFLVSACATKWYCFKVCVMLVMCVLVSYTFCVIIWYKYIVWTFFSSATVVMFPVNLVLQSLSH